MLFGALWTSKKMPKGKLLSERERGIIIGLLSKGSGQTSIENSIKRSRGVVKNVLRNLEEYGTIQRPGRPSKLSIAAKRRLIREAYKGRMTAENLRKEQQFLCPAVATECCPSEIREDSVCSSNN